MEGHSRLSHNYFELSPSLANTLSAVLCITVTAKTNINTPKNPLILI